MMPDQVTNLRMDNPLHFCLEPGPPPTIPGYEIAGSSCAKTEAAGDFYDYLTLNDERQGFVIGDPVLSPHYIARGLFAAATQACIRKLTHEVDDIAGVVSLLNKLLHGELEENSFCMCSLLILHPKTRQVEHVGAGHQAYWFNENGDNKGRLESTGLPLGLFPDAQYEETKTVQLETGDMILMLTDGFQETISPDHRLFGMEKVFEVIRSEHKKSSQEILQSLNEASREFRGELPQRDDMTAILIRVTA